MSMSKNFGLILWNKQGSVIPDSMGVVLTLSHAENATLATASNTNFGYHYTKSFKLNNIYDGYGSTVQPYGYDQLAALYNQYYVYKVTWTVECTPTHNVESQVSNTISNTMVIYTQEYDTQLGAPAALTGNEGTINELMTAGDLKAKRRHFNGGVPALSAYYNAGEIVLESLQRKRNVVRGGTKMGFLKKYPLEDRITTVGTASSGPAPAHQQSVEFGFYMPTATAGNVDESCYIVYTFKIHCVWFDAIPFAVSS